MPLHFVTIATVATNATVATEDFRDFQKQFARLGLLLALGRITVHTVSFRLSHLCLGFDP